MLFLTLTPNLAQLPTENQLDKLYHAFGFFIYTILLLKANGHMHRLGVWFSAAALGLGIEIAQLYIPGRSFDTWDWLADMFGVATGLIAAQLLRRGTTQS